MFRGKELTHENPKIQQGVDNDDRSVDEEWKCKKACERLYSCIAITWRWDWNNGCILHEARDMELEPLETRNGKKVHFFMLTRNCGEYRSGRSERTKLRSNRKYWSLLADSRLYWFKFRNGWFSHFLNSNSFLSKLCYVLYFVCIYIISCFASYLRFFSFISLYETDSLFMILLFIKKKIKPEIKKSISTPITCKKIWIGQKIKITYFLIPSLNKFVSLNIR